MSIHKRDYKILVGTLYSGENELEECIASINSQTYTNFQQYIFRNLPDKVAHQKLFRFYSEKKDEFDLLIKVDADMVLCDNSFFSRVVEKFRTTEKLNILIIPVYDFFSDQNIMGMGVYRNTIGWLDNARSDLFTEIPLGNEFEKQISYDLAPAAIHCKNPSPLQAFHYGLHRGLKVIQFTEKNKDITSSKSMFMTLEKTWRNFEKTLDIRLGYAILGAELSYLKVFKLSDINYTSDFPQKILNNFLHFSSKQLLFILRLIRFINYSFFSYKKRWQLLLVTRGNMPVSQIRGK